MDDIYEEYEKQDWKNYPDETTPISEERLTHIENGIENVSKELKKNIENEWEIVEIPDDELDQWEMEG